MSAKTRRLAAGSIAKAGSMVVWRSIGIGKPRHRTSPQDSRLTTTMKLMIVEDNRQMRQMIRSVVADLAEAVIECADGAEVVLAYAAQKFSGGDRVLMDLHMPGIGGLEATRRIRSAFPDARIIIVTQYDDQHWRTAAKEAGACGYVLKENLLELRDLLQGPSK